MKSSVEATRTCIPYDPFGFFPRVGCAAHIDELHPFPFDLNITSDLEIDSVLESIRISEHQQIGQMDVWSAQSAEDVVCETEMLYGQFHCTSFSRKSD